MEVSDAMGAFAYVVGSQGGPGAALMDMAQGLGFSGVAPYVGIKAAEQQVQQNPICYFLFSAVDDVRSLRGIAETIRFSPGRRLRFSPLIYFAESPSLEFIGACINMGFDDVITLPFTPRRVLDRIARQVDNSFIYYETSGYFGPDRRGRETGSHHMGKQRTGGPFRRFEIIRSITNGINIVRDDQFTARGFSTAG